MAAKLSGPSGKLLRGIYKKMRIYSYKHHSDVNNNKIFLKNGIWGYLDRKSVV